jgi:DNA-binding CsgD family transcriptional regulator/PAS domain-containing protein
MTDASLPAITELIGEIYDCAIDPAHWPETLRRICALLDGVASQLYVVDLDTGAHRFATGWGEAPERTRELVERYQGPSADWQRRAILERGAAADPDEPIVLRRLAWADEVVNSAFFRGWADALGYCDMLAAVVLRQRDRVGLVGVARHRDVGIATDREVALMRALAPHLRRAAAIGDMLDMARLEASALREAMDGLAVGIGVVAADGALLHANRAAEAMMRAPNGPIRSVGGRLAGRRPQATSALSEAIAAAAQSDRAIGGAGIGVVLNDADPDAPPSVAHVLPLTGGRARPGVAPGAAAAVFISRQGDTLPPAAVAAALRSLGLTAAEARLAERLAAGATLVEAAKALGIAETTAKTHLAHVFDKAGVTRQTELMALLARLSSPLAER